MSAEQLMFHFATMAAWEWTDAVREIHDELIRRGYVYDERYRDFLTCAQWNARWGDVHPRACGDPPTLPLED